MGRDDARRRDVEDRDRRKIRAVFLFVIPGAGYPRSMDRANLADRVGMTATGGTFQTYLSRLKTNGLINITGRKITAGGTLFMDVP